MPHKEKVCEISHCYPPLFNRVEEVLFSFVGSLAVEGPPCATTHAYNVKLNHMEVLLKTFEYRIVQSAGCPISMDEYKFWFLLTVMKRRETCLYGVDGAPIINLNLTDPYFVLAEPRKGEQLSLSFIKQLFAG